MNPNKLNRNPSKTKSNLTKLIAIHDVEQIVQVLTACVLLTSVCIFHCEHKAVLIEKICSIVC